MSVLGIREFYDSDETYSPTDILKFSMSKEKLPSYLGTPRGGIFKFDLTKAPLQDNLCETMQGLGTIGRI
jgi:hypothetical protein